MYCACCVATAGVKPYLLIVNLLCATFAFARGSFFASNHFPTTLAKLENSIESTKTIHMPESRARSETFSHYLRKMLGNCLLVGLDFMTKFIFLLLFCYLCPVKR